MQISEKGYNFLIGKMYFTGNDGYQNFLVFAPMLISLILGSNRKFINWILTRISSEKITSFDTNLGPTMSNLDIGKLILKFNNSVLVQKNFFSLYSNFITFFYHFTNNFTTKVFYFGTVKLTWNADKSKFTYNGQGKAFDGRAYWSFDNGTVRNVVIFGVDNSLSSHINNPKNNFLALGEGPTEGINGSGDISEKNWY